MHVFLHHESWIQDKAGFINRIDQYLTIASNHNIKTIFSKEEIDLIRIECLNKN
jgi:hypothetical protein